MTSGGKRAGAGRPKGKPTTRIRVPVRFLLKIKNYINRLLKKENE